MGFTLDEGENEISLRYELPGKKKGIAITLIAFAACVLLWHNERKYREMERVSK